MNRTTRTVVVIGTATLIAAIASFGVYTAVKSVPVREVEVAHMYVAVAARNLPPGASVGERDVKLVAWPSKHPVSQSFSTVEEVVNRGLVAGVVENEPLTQHKLAPRGSGAGLPPTIPPGMRAMSVKVDEVIGVAGFVAPGTRVDVVVTLRQSGDSNEPMSRAIVSNVLVLTSGTRLDQEQAKDGKPHPSTVVTLAVSPDDAERFALASVEGRISLSLRNPMDVAPTDTAGVRVTALMRGMRPDEGESLAPPAPARRGRPEVARAAAPISALPVLAPPSIYTVETIRAAKRADEVVK